MPRLPKAVVYSDSYTFSSTVSGRPAKSLRFCDTWFQRSASDFACTRLTAAIAPALTSGFTEFSYTDERQLRVERHARGLDADLLLEHRRALLRHHQRGRERLRHRLDRELVVDVAGAVDLAVLGDDHHAEQVARRLGQDRDVVGVLAVLQTLVLGIGGVDQALEVLDGRVRQRPFRVHRRRQRQRQRGHQPGGQRIPVDRFHDRVPRFARYQSLMPKLYFTLNWKRTSSSDAPSLFSRWPHISSPPSITFSTG